MESSSSEDDELLNRLQDVVQGEQIFNNILGNADSKPESSWI